MDSLKQLSYLGVQEMRMHDGPLDVVQICVVFQSLQTPSELRIRETLNSPGPVSSLNNLNSHSEHFQTN